MEKPFESAYDRGRLRPRYPESIPPGKIREKLLELFGMADIPVKVDYSVGRSRVEDGIRLTDLTYANSHGETVPAILIEPLNDPAEHLPGVVCVPGTGGSAERMALERFYKDGPNEPPLFGWARELARRGYVALAISPKGCHGRGTNEVSWYIELKHLLAYGISQMGLLVEEALRGVRVLQVQDRIGANKVGLTGMSLGGNATWYAMACAPWLAAGVPVCGGVGQLERVIREGDLYRHSAYFYVPHMLRYFDHPEIVANCIAPRPFMMVAPTSDEDMPKSGVDELKRVVAPVYRDAGAADCFRVYQPDGNHVFRFEYFEWMVAWFDRFIKGECA
ncbi:MAG: hypothetical protein OXO51_19170 [Gemmatimonadota bacterium]|nr:hypothetical protein [Gemmatimonadota bacterium]